MECSAEPSSKTSASSEMSEDMMSEMECPHLNSVGCVTCWMKNMGFISVWDNGLHSVYFQQDTVTGHLKLGSLVHVVAKYSSKYKRYNATSVTELSSKPVQHSLSSIGVIVKCTKSPRLIMDITTARLVQFDSSCIEGPSLQSYDLVHFSAVLDHDLKAQYQATSVCRSKLKNPQFGLVIKAPTAKKAGRIKAFCNGSVMTGVFTHEHSPLHIKRLQRVAFDADIDPDFMKLKVKAIEMLDLPSKLAVERQEAKGVVIKDTGSLGMIMDTADFIGVSFDYSIWDFTIGCPVIYSAKLVDQCMGTYQADPSLGTYQATQVLKADTRSNQVYDESRFQTRWEKEAVEHFKERLYRHTSIRVCNLNGHLQQTSCACRNELKDETKLREFLARNSSVFTISKTDDVTLCLKEEPKEVPQQSKPVLKKESVVEQKAVDYLVMCLEKHKTVTKEKLSGYLSQASREVQILLNSDLDKFLQKYACYFKVSLAGTITLKSVGEFNIGTELTGTKLVDSFTNSDIDTKTDSGFSASAKHIEGNSVVIPVTNQWYAGKTVDTLFGPSSRMPQTVENSRSKPVKLLHDWEVEARQFVMGRLEKHDKIYLMNLHSHMQHASETVRNRLRGQDAQRQFLMKHKDLFRIDDADLITLREKQVDSKTETPIQNGKGTKGVTNSQQPGTVSASANCEVRLQTCSDIEMFCKPSGSCKNIETENCMKNTDDRPDKKCVRVLTLPNSLDIFVTPLVFDALQFIAPVFKRKGTIKKSNLFGHFDQSEAHVHAAMCRPENTDRFVSLCPEIFTENEGYVTMRELKFSDDKQSCEGSFRYEATRGVTIPRSQANRVDVDHSEESRSLECSTECKKESVASSAYIAREIPDEYSDINVNSLCRDQRQTQNVSAMTKLPSTETEDLVDKSVHHDLLGVTRNRLDCGLEGRVETQDEDIDRESESDDENKTGASSCLRCVTVLSDTKPWDTCILFVTPLEYDALKYIAPRFRKHRTIARKNLIGHFAQSDVHIKSAYMSIQGIEDFLARFPEVFSDKEGCLTMAELNFSDAARSVYGSLESRSVTGSNRHEENQTKEVSKESRYHKTSENGREETIYYDQPDTACDIDKEEIKHKGSEVTEILDEEHKPSDHMRTEDSLDDSEIKHENIEGHNQTRQHVGDSFSATLNDNTWKMHSTTDVLNERGTLDKDIVLGKSSLRYITILDYPSSRNIPVTQLQYDALKHIATRFKKHGKIEKQKLFGHFGQSDDHVRSEFCSTAGTDRLIAQFPDIFLENEGKLMMVDLSFECSAYPLRELSSFRVSDGGLLEESVTSKEGAARSVEGKDHSTSALSFASHRDVMQDSITFSTHSQSDGSTNGKVENVEALSPWEIEAKAFIASKLVKHKHIFLRNLHSHFAGAPKSVVQNLHGYEKQREFLLRHTDFFRVDDEDLISLIDSEFSSAWSDSGSSVPHATSVSSSHSLSREPDQKHDQKGNFVGVGKITRLYQRTQGGFVEDMDTAEIIHFRAKTAGLECTDIADVFKVDDFVAFQAGPRESGVIYPNGILKMMQIDEREAEALHFIIKRLKKVGPISLQNLSRHFSIASEAIRQLVLPMEKLEGFFVKHSLLFNQQPGSVSLKGHALAKKPSSGSGDKKLSSGPDSGDKKLSSVSDAGDKKPISGLDYGEIKPPNRPHTGDQHLSGASDPGEKKPSNGSDSGYKKPSSESDSGDKKPSSEVDEKWFKALIHTQKCTISTYVKKWQFLVLQHVRSALQPLDNKVQLSKLHELILQSPQTKKNLTQQTKLTHLCYSIHQSSNLMEMLCQWQKSLLRSGRNPCQNTCRQKLQSPNALKMNH